MIRQPVVAGGFYPADKNSLINQINNFLDEAKVISAKGKLKILIIPHAGYDYSGQIAAWGFKQIKKNYKTVVILGSSHSSYFSGAVVWNKGSWQTPLGLTDVDENFANQLIYDNLEIKSNFNAHLNEHSLEVELPFVQKVLNEAKIVPILLGHSGSKVLEVLAEVLTRNLDDKTLLIISSDLSHYPSYEVANKVDKETIEAIISGDVENFDQVIKKNLDQPGTDTCACGSDAIKVAMLLAKELKINEIKLLKYANSGDKGGDKARVVGYAAIGFYSSLAKTPCFSMETKPGRRSLTRIHSKEKTKNLISESGQKKLLEIARKTLESYLKNQKIPNIEIDDRELNQNLGAFVTLRKNGRLRGCIGEFEPKRPLYKVVQDKTIDAAFHDPRFYPIEFEELKDIKIEISVLSSKIKIDDWQKIELGKHGVVIQKDSRKGTFLPQVAEETDWILEEFLGNLCSYKLGLPRDCYKEKDTDIFSFTAQIFKEE